MSVETSSSVAIIISSRQAMMKYSLVLFLLLSNFLGAVPTFAPTTKPSASPSVSPTLSPTFAPSTAPTVLPTGVPTAAPSSSPTRVPTVVPTSFICTGAGQLVYGLPTCVMPESTDGGVRAWNEVDSTGVVISSSVCTVAVCGRDRDIYYLEKIFFEQHRGAHALGRYFTNGVWEMTGGSLMYPGSSEIITPTEPTTTSPTSSPTTSSIFELVGLEVIQVVQNLQNKVPLIANKKTFIRAFVQFVDGKSLDDYKGLDTDDIVGFFNLKRNGQVIVEGYPKVKASNILSDVLSSREEVSSSFNFEMDLVTSAGVLEVEFGLYGDNADAMECKENLGNAQLSNCKESVTFISTTPLEIVYYNVKYPGGVDVSATKDLFNQNKRLKATFPVAHATTHSFSHLEYKQVPRILDVYNFLRYYIIPREYSGGVPLNRFYVALFKNGLCSDHETAGCTSPRAVGRGWASAAVSLFTDEVTKYNYLAAAHEIAHAAGRPHAVKKQIVLDKNGTPKLGGVCGEIAELHNDIFPYFSIVDGKEVATIGPLTDGVYDMVYGLDTIAMTGTLQNSDIVPPQRFALMSYCGYPETVPWMSRETYTKLLPKFSLSTARRNTETIESERTYKMFVLSLQDGQVVIDSIVEVLSHRDHELLNSLFLGSGNYSLVIKNADGDEVREFFGFEEGVSSPEFEEDTGSSEVMRAVVFTEYFADMVSSAVESVNGTEMTVVYGSVHRPVVTLLYPNGGETVDSSSGEMVISWSASDADGDSLLFDVMYSADGGLVWFTLVIGHNESSLLVDLSNLEGSDIALVRVMVTDGFHSNSDKSNGFFTVPNNAPVVTILSPHADDVYVSVSDEILFEADVYDIEDREDIANVTWISSVDGILSTTSSFRLSASHLSMGQHQIFVTAWDTHGNSNTPVSQSLTIVSTTDYSVWPSPFLLLVVVLIGWCVCIVRCNVRYVRCYYISAKLCSTTS